MSMLLLALALAAPASDGRPGHAVTCSVSVAALDDQGREHSARRVSASVAPSVVFRGQVSPRNADAPPLLFDVFNPRGLRYQVLVAQDRADARGLRQQRKSRARQASLAVAGSSIAWTSMYGQWRVEPRIEGTSRRCGPPEYFTIRP